MRTNSAAALSLVVAATAFVALPARAHISLNFPKGRYWQTTGMQTDQNKQKTGPCGVANDARTKDASLVTTFKPGEKVMVKFQETIQHPGHFEISFDSDGQDFPFPGEAPSATSGVTVLANKIADKTTNDYTYEVTLPNMECEKCTLQLVQVMTTDAPPYAKSGDLYFQCADIAIKAGDGGTGGAAGTSGGMAGNSGSSGGSSNGGTANGGASGGSNAGGSSGSGASGSSNGGSANGTGGTMGSGTGGTMGMSTGGTSSAGGVSTGGSITGGVTATTGGVLTATGGAATGGITSGPTTGGIASATGGVTGSPPGTPEEEPGCSVSHAPRSSAPFSLLALAGLFAWQRRRRGARSR